MRDDGLWLENERKRGLQSSKMRPRYLLKHSRRPLGGPRARLELSGDGAGIYIDAAWALQSPPELLWGAFVGALGVSPGAFWLIFLVQEGI